MVESLQCYGAAIMVTGEESPTDAGLHNDIWHCFLKKMIVSPVGIVDGAHYNRAICMGYYKVSGSGSSSSR